MQKLIDLFMSGFSKFSNWIGKGIEWLITEIAEILK